MNTIVAVPPVAERVVRPPKASVLWAIALAGLILSVLAAVFGLTNNDVDDQQMVLYLWMIVPYTVAGLVAWSRRPQSHLGLLLIAGGLGTGLSALQFSDHSLPYTIGAALDLLPAAILLHVFLAFPDGRLRSRFERVLVAIAYPAAVGVQVFRLTLGSSDNLMEVGSATEVADDARLARSAVGDLIVELRTDLPPVELEGAVARAQIGRAHV